MPEKFEKRRKKKTNRNICRQRENRNITEYGGCVQLLSALNFDMAL